MFIFTAKEMNDMDRITMEETSLEGKMLMENAGRAISERLEQMREKSDRILVLAGSGNNGGDGFVAARTLMNDFYDVQVVQVVPDEKITGDALYHKQLLENFGGEVARISESAELGAWLSEADVVVDAMIGTGINGELREPLAGMVKLLNDSPVRTISLDIPSGLPAGEGVQEFTAVQADQTIIVAAPKISAFLQATASYYGSWETVSIGMPMKVLRQHATRQVWTAENFRQTMPSRQQNDHKGDHGKGLVIGGSAEMPGSLAMTVRAALRTGAGLITAATTERVMNMIAPWNVEATYLTLGETNGVLNNDKPVPADAYDAVALGIGMGRSKDTEALVHQVMEKAPGPVVVDADALHHVKADLAILENRTNPTVLTPHPGEMAMLLGLEVPELLAKPFAYSEEFARKYQVYVVLKGSHTIITAPDGTQGVNPTGNPGLAKGGSGDILTGMVLAMVMQKQEVFPALCNACYLHGEAADRLVDKKHSYHDLLASDVIEGIADAYRSIS
ncbi:NAD(P)H-hydrate dehydratase [Lentibacillus sediminis]|uniref:NAD(P)H-hydrate dehydratase n=1 Tax=Lentibacillus sediminis TaxID=1940529 RepID=UPI000C1C68BC|nr:NAD(P)H-hydrate dehydratase [Lentibacillus sediminis]